MVMLLMLWMGAAHGELLLVDENRAFCTVVMGEDDGLSKTDTYHRSIRRLTLPSGALASAAGDLADYLNDMGRIGVPENTVKVVQNADEARTPYRILLGTAAIEEHGLAEEAAGLSYPGYIYRTIGNDLVIFGATSKGTANGVYGFLQDELGMRWFGPQELFTLVPRRDRIAVEHIDRRVEPSYTGNYGLAVLHEMHDHPWKRRMRLAELGDSNVTRSLEPFSAPSHHVHRIIPSNRYFETNPEYFRMQEGRRYVRTESLHNSLCWTNPEVIDLATEAARERFSKGAHYHMFSLGIADMEAYCQCDECEAIQPERYYRGRSRTPTKVASDMYFHFVNEVARRVKKDYPDRYIGVIAYSDVSAPPVGEVEDNVFVCIVLDISEHYDPEVKEQDEALIRAWEEKNVTLGLYYYIGLAKLVPAYFPRHLAATLKDLHQRGFRGLRSEAYPGWPWTGPMVYVDARLWWDIDLDVDELLHEYFRRLYGPAAPYMEAMYARFEEIHMRPRSGGFLYEHYNFLQFRPYTSEDFEKIKNLLASAHDAIERLGSNWLGRTNLAERRLAYTTTSLRLFLDMLEGVVLTRELEAMDMHGDDLDVMEALRTVERIIDLSARHERIYREAILTDPYHSGRYYSDTATPVRAQWKQYLSRVSGEKLIKLHNGIDSGTLNPDGRVENYLQRLGDRYSSLDVSSEALFKLGTGLWQLESENLIRNPGFEEVDGRHDDYPEHLQWRPSDADHWAFWQRSRTGRFTVSDEIRRSGRRSALVRGVGNGTLVARAPDVRPGEYYYFSIYAKNLTEPEDRTEVRVMIDWLDEEGNWMRERVMERFEGYDDWVKADGVVRAPAGAADAVMILIVSNLPSGADVYFDDADFRRVEGP